MSSIDDLRRKAIEGYPRALNARRQLRAAGYDSNTQDILKRVVREHEDAERAFLEAEREQLDPDAKG